MSSILQDSISSLLDGQSLTEAQMTECMNAIMDVIIPEDDIAQFLVALSDKGESVDEITGAARVMRDKARRIKSPIDALDCCGTGGDASGTYNISTAVAIVTASCGVPVAKHGNRAASSKSGAADVLEALGVNLDATDDLLVRALNDLHFAFLMAPHHHASMRHVSAVRKKLGRRTIFNILGPLVNPAGAQYQLLGVFDQKWIVPMAETLKRLGTKRAWVVHGHSGLDEISLTGSTQCAEVSDKKEIREFTLTPDDFDLPSCTIEDLRGGDAQENAIALRAILEGKKGAYREMVLANTAAALVIYGAAPDLIAGVKMAANAIDQGLAYKTLNDYIVLTQNSSGVIA
jgi:anthranilate phosphoribosyltransferase